MKLLSGLIVCALALSSAEELPRGKKIQLCGSDLAKAMQRVCVDGDLDFLNQHIQDHHQHDHFDHRHNHQHDHQHDHHEWKGHAMKREALTSLADECCLKSCDVQDFVSYCPPK